MDENFIFQNLIHENPREPVAHFSYKGLFVHVSGEDLPSGIYDLSCVPCNRALIRS